MIIIKNLTKEYGKKIILDNINLEIPSNQLSCIIGPNGAGKSTLISIIAKIDDYLNGTILIQDKSIKKYSLSQYSKKVSFLKQQNYMDLKLKVFELIEFGRFPHSSGKLNLNDKKIIDETILMMNLEKIKNSYIDEISGGERQRVFLAMVIVQDTEYILLDEPLNNLDMKHAVEIMQTLKRLVNDYKKTIIVVVHDINFAANYADYIIGIKNGKPIITGNVHQVINEKNLEQLFEIPFRIEKKDNNFFCNYYKN